MDYDVCAYWPLSYPAGVLGGRSDRADIFSGHRPLSLAEGRSQRVARNVTERRPTVPASGGPGGLENWDTGDLPTRGLGSGNERPGGAGRRFLQLELARISNQRGHAVCRKNRSISALASGPFASVYDPAPLPPNQAWPPPWTSQCSSSTRPSGLRWTVRV